jgi:hypothetical protein
MFTHGTRNRPRDRGREETVFEVHYCFEDPENDFARLTELHDAFTSAFVRMTSPDVLSRVVLDGVPSDGMQLKA